MASVASGTTGDAIVAVGTPGGAGSRHLIRLSGPTLLPSSTLSARLRGPARDLVAGSHRGIAPGRWRLGATSGDGPPPERGSEADPDDHPCLDLPVLVSTAPGPASFTGEDVVEIQCPGHPRLAAMLRDGIVADLERDGTPARAAGPGEFSARAWLAGRLGADEAIGIALAIEAERDEDLRLVEDWRGHERRIAVSTAREHLVSLLARLEAGIDFTDEEDVVGCSARELARGCREATSAIERLRAAWAAIGGEAATQPTVVFTGPPNAGKSTLVNRLAGRERLVVSAVAGTTRDAVEVAATWEAPDGMPTVVRLVDTAGIDEFDPTAVATTDPLADVAARATVDAISKATVIVRCRAVDQGEADEPSAAPTPTPTPGSIAVRTKADLRPEAEADPDPDQKPGRLSVSTHTGEGIETLRSRILEAVRERPAAGGGGMQAVVLTLGIGLADALRHLGAVLDQLPDPESAAAAPRPEIVAAELRDAIDALGRVEGGWDPEQVLDQVFGRFCIGK